MKFFNRLSGANRIFLISLPVAVLVASGVLFLSGRQFLAKTPCGCGIPAPEATGEFQPGEETAIFNNQPVDYKIAELTPPQEVLKQQEGAVLGVQIDERWIEIDLSEQKLYAHDGNNIDYEFLISSGKWVPTPTGEFRIWIKLKYTKMEGGRRGTRTYYYLPNVPYTQYFYKDYGLHGTYWHNNFGQPMSHGCVNLATPDAEKLFYWTSPPVPEGRSIAYPSKDNPGTRVVIHD
ncbi:MAG: L,D-transpeptidase [Microgenomates group bacterium]